MKADDPRLEESRKKLFERIQKIDDLKRTMPNKHLMLEQCMNGLLDAWGKKHKGLRFAEKAKLCEDLKPPNIERPIWKVVTAVNRLRNEIAHNLDQAQIQAKMDELRAAYLAALTPTQRKGAEQLDDANIAASACELCGGCLVAATEAAKAPRKA